MIGNTPDKNKSDYKKVNKQLYYKPTPDDERFTRVYLTIDDLSTIHKKDKRANALLMYITIKMRTKNHKNIIKLTSYDSKKIGINSKTLTSVLDSLIELNILKPVDNRPNHYFVNTKYISTVSSNHFNPFDNEEPSESEEI